MTALLGAAAVGVIACMPARAVRTVQWYDENPTEREAELMRCHALPEGSRQADDDCRNAEKARKALERAIRAGKR